MCLHVDINPPPVRSFVGRERQRQRQGGGGEKDRDRGGGGEKDRGRDTGREREIIFPHIENLPGSELHLSQNDKRIRRIEQNPGVTPISARPGFWFWVNTDLHTCDRMVVWLSLPTALRTRAPCYGVQSDRAEHHPISEIAVSLCSSPSCRERTSKRHATPPEMCTCDFAALFPET